MNQSLTDPYKQIWETRDLGSLEPGQLALDNKLPEWRRGLGAFGDEMQATGHGLVALGAQGLQNAVGENEFLTGVRDWGLEGYDRNIKESHSGLNTPSVGKIEDIKSAADFGSWAGYQLGKGLPMLGSLIASGGVGGAVGRMAANKGIKELAKKGLKDQAEALAKKSFTRGSLVGGTGGSFGLEGGLAYGEQVASGADPERAVASGIGVGAVNAALEFLPLYSVAKKIGVGDFAKKGIYETFFKDKKLGAAAIELARRVGGAGAVGAATEGVTEGLQELMNIAGQRWANEEAVLAPLSDEDKSQLLNAAAAGGLVGGSFAGGVGAFAGPQAAPTPDTTNQDTPTPDQDTPAPTETEQRVAQIQTLRDQAEQALPAAQAARDTEQVRKLEETIRAADSGLEQLRQREAQAAGIDLSNTRPLEEAQREAAATDTLGTRVGTQQELPLDAPVQPREVEAQPETNPRELPEEKQAELEALKANREQVISAQQAKQLTPEDAKGRVDQIDTQIAELQGEKQERERPDPARQLALNLEGMQQQQEETKRVVEAVKAKQAPQEPVVQEPVVEEPVVQETVAQEPVVEEPAAPQEPVVEEPTTAAEPTPVAPTPEAQLQEVEAQYQNGLITLTEKKLGQAKVNGTYEGLEFTEVGTKPRLVKKDAEGNEKALVEEFKTFGVWGVTKGNELKEYATLDEAVAAANETLAPKEAQYYTDASGLAVSAKKKLADGWLNNTEVVYGDKVSDSEALINAFALGNQQHLQEQAAEFTNTYGPAETLGVMKEFVNGEIATEGGTPLTATQIAQQLDLPEIADKNLDGWDVNYSPSGELLVSQTGTDGTNHFVAPTETGGYAAVMIPPNADAVVTEVATFEEAQTVAEANIAENLVAAMQTPAAPQTPVTDTEVADGATPTQAPATTTQTHDLTDLAAKVDDDFAGFTPEVFELFSGTGSHAFVSNMGAQAYADLHQGVPSNWVVKTIDIEDGGEVPVTWVNSQDGSQTIEQYMGVYTAKQNGGVAATENTMAEALAAFEAAPTQTTSPIPAGQVTSGWAPAGMPTGYKLADGFSSAFKPFEGGRVTLHPNATPELVETVAQIHNYIHTSDIPVAEKIKLLNNIPKNQNELAAFQQQHPFLLRKVSVAQAQNEQEAVQFLHDIVSRRDKYKFEEILAETGTFADTYGEAALAAALVNAPAPQGRVPSLQGWLEGLVTEKGIEGIRSEQDLANENPHDGIWADYPTRGGGTLVGGTGNVHAARYGVVIVNPKDGKVLLRKVRNQYEGITWDFARGGADYKNQAGTDTFGGLTAERIDRGPSSGSNPNHKRWFEHPLLAAKREAKEEFGLDVQVIGQLAKGFYDGDRGMASLYYVAVPAGVQDHNTYLNPTHGVQETDETRWVDLQEARELVRTLPTVETGPQYASHAHLKHDEHFLPRLNRIARTLEAVYDPSMQKSDFAYRAPAAAMEKFFKGRMKDSFPALYKTLANKPNVADMSELQKIKVASALYIESRYKTADISTKKTLVNEEIKRREASLKSWIKDRLGMDTMPGMNMIVNAAAQLDTIKQKAAANNGKIVLSMWHGSKRSRELMVGDKINPFLLSSGWGGPDTSHGMFFTDKESKAKQWGGLGQVNVLVAFDNLKIVEHEVDYGSVDVTQAITEAKQQGYDGIYYNKMGDAVDGRQIIVWNTDNMIAGGGQGVNHTGQNLYQTRGELGQPLDTGTARVLLDEALGERTAKRLLDEGVLELVESGGPDGVAGHFHAAEGKIKLYLNYITSPRELLGALFHEGSHAGMRYMLGDSVERYHKELLEGGGEVVKRAMFKTAMEGAQRFGIEHSIGVGNDAEIARVRSELTKLDPNFLLEEDLANFVQQGQHGNPGLWRKIVNAIKTWWATSSVGKFLKERGIGLQLTDDLAVALVTASLRNAAAHQGKDYSTYVAHTTGKAWPSAGAKYPHGKPNLKYVLKGDGEGYISYGWGFYALESQATLDYYKQGVGSATYGFHVPDDITSRLIEWDRPIGQQHPAVQQGILDPRDNYLLLRMATRARNRVSSYPSGPKMKDFNTGSGLYSELRDFLWRKEYDAVTTYKEPNGSYTVRYWENGEKENTGLTKEAAVAFVQQRLPQKSSWSVEENVSKAKQGTPHTIELSGHMHDNETNKNQRKKNLARRWASRKMADYGIAGVHLLDAGSREVQITRKSDGSFRVQQGLGHTLTVKNLSAAELEKHVGPELAGKAQQQPVGQPQDHTGFGFYNWVFWRQSDLDRLHMVYKKGNQVNPLPGKNTHYDTNGIGEPFAENPGVSDWVINPKTGEQLYHSQTERTLPIDVDELRTSVDNVMGEGWLATAEQAGLVEVVDGVGPNGESGSWDGKKIRLYAGSMPVGGSAAGVLLHEGKHATFEQVLGDALPSFVADLKTMAAAGNQAAQRAITQSVLAAAKTLGIAHNLNEPGATVTDRESLEAAIEERAPGLLAEESLAYFVQNAADGTGGGLFRRLLNALKAWFSQTAVGQALKERGIGFELTEGMAVEWAKLGLHKTMNQVRRNEQVRREVLHKASTMQASELLGTALQKQAEADPLYAMSLAEIQNQLWNDPTDPRPEVVNRPGFFQKARAGFVDFFAEIEKVNKGVYDEYSLVRNKKAARMEQIKRNFAEPLRELIAGSPWTPEVVSDMLAARHIKVDGVNKELAKRASDRFLKQLMKNDRLTPAQVKQLQKERMFIKSGKMPDGSDYVDTNGNLADMTSATKRELMFNLMERYAAKEKKNAKGNQEIKTEWEIFKDGAAGFSDGGAASAEVRKVDDILQDADQDQALFDEIASVFDALNRTTLETLREGELITDAELARLLADKSAYAPLRREAYDLDETIEAIFKQGTGGGKQLSTRGGSMNPSEPVLVLQNALAKAEASAAAAERNLANNYLYDTINQDRKAWKPWFFIIDKDKYATHDADGFLVDRNSTAQNKSDIALIRKGQKLLIRPNMHNERAMGFVRAVNNMDAQRLNGPMQVMNWFNGIVRWVNVSASPVFLLMNAFKDPFTAAYNMQATEAAPYMKEIFSEGYPRAFRALHKVFVKGERNPLDPDVALVERFEAAGGRTSFIEALKEMDSTWRNFDGQVKRRQQAGIKELMWFRDTALERIENLNIMMENVIRLSAFDIMTSKGGLSKKQAARLAQDLTTNFTRRGYYSQSLGVWWLFFNATVQGNYQVVRNLMESKKLWGAVGGTVAFSLMLDLMGRALFPDDWDEIPEWDKERFIIAPFKVGGEFVKIPAPWVYNIFWRMGGMLGETAAGVRKPQDTVVDLTSMSLTALNPIASGSMAQAVAPTALDPFVQILENKDFAGNPLAPEGFPGVNRKANAELFWNSTPKVYRDMAGLINEATGGSPVESGLVDLRPADYKVLVNFLTGSLGRFMSDSALGMKGAASGDIDSFKDIPLMGEFFSDPYGPMRATKYHDNVAKVYGAHKLEKLYREGPDRDLIKLHELRKERAKDLRMYKQAQDVERQLKSLRQRQRAAQGRGDTTRVEQLREQVEKIQDRFNESYGR